ncbi:capsular exopolysaccharide synthesis family protein [Sediminihabitans luteus]|uniref:non-specific protein-tyrosine kinase n=1 Tax=Sediminihabitans luteus TaxID=1138585 RepID=A0A2M9CDB4_9CELL|nr:polysaccharide biosynthesis tyrosine autokinase [Sediminihabitans luteus]PJJ69878.1 capsular exopolysaccharide synthesis family protein [Sediminihabitans luteus]GII99197.1 chromosome partitioning protein [Sediminihabitans luteus]
MTLNEYAATLVKHWLVIALCMLAGGALGYAYAKSQVPMYQSSASVMVVPEQGENTSELVQGSNYVQNLVASYAVLATSPYVLGPVIDDLGLDDTPTSLANRVTVDTPLNTVVIQISALDADPDVAREIAGATAAQLAVAVPELSPELADDSPAVRVTTIAEARQPVNPVSPNTRLLTMLGIVVGGLVGAAYAVARRLLARRITNRTTIESVAAAPVLGEVVVAPNGRTLPQELAAAPGSRASESVRTLLANLRFANVDKDHRVLLVTSGDASEGKSSISAALSIALAEDDSRVLLVDADLRRPSIDRLTGLEGSVGLTNLLVGDVELGDVVQHWGSTNLDVLPTGALPPNPGSLLASTRMAAVIETLRRSYDYVIIDCAPLLPLSDPLWLTQRVDGVVVVAREGRTKIARLRQTLADLERSGCDIVGVVLNGARAHGRSEYYVRPARTPSDRKMRRPTAKTG